MSDAPDRPNSEPPNPKKAKKARAGMPRSQLVALVAIVLVFVFAFASKVAAQGGGGPRPGGPRPALAKPPAEKSEAKEAKPDPKAAGAEKAGGEAKKEEKEPLLVKQEEKDETADQVKTAKVGPKGGVPTHSEGEYRSPFANPSFGRVTAKVGFLLETVEEYDIKKGAFSGHFFVSMTSEKPMPKIDLQPTNGKLDQKEVLADTPTFKMWKFAGTFHEKPDLHAYPFDTQELVIELEDDSNGFDSLRLEADPEHTNLDSDFNVPGWDVAYLRARVLNHYYPDRFDNDDLYYSRFVVAVGIRRFATSALFTVFVPALVIVMISLSGLWFPRDELEVRCNATTPMLAAAVLFHFALMQELPATAYLSRADKLMMAVYGCLFLHMLSSWIWFVFDEKHTETIFKWAKIVCTPITLTIMALGILA